MGDEPVWMLDEVLKDRERLAAELELPAVVPQPFVA
jgi:hypothetical protein